MLAWQFTQYPGDACTAEGLAGLASEWQRSQVAAFSLKAWPWAVCQFSGWGISATWQLWQNCAEA